MAITFVQKQANELICYCIFSRAHTIVAITFVQKQANELICYCIFSRAHTIVAITFVQKQANETGQSMTRTSTVNLVDLAG